MATFGYGKKTFVQALARVCCHLIRYLAKHDATLKKYLPGTVYTCVVGMIPCLTSVCDLINKSAA
jgi:hypothetical protein